MKSAVLNGEMSCQFEGLLEIFNTPPKGSKEFCGKIIDLDFYHKVEMPSFIRSVNDASMVESLYLSEEQSYDGEQGDYALCSAYEEEIERMDYQEVLRKVKNLAYNISLVQSERYVSSYEENEEDNERQRMGRYQY
jgi:hypothetical protein